MQPIFPGHPVFFERQGKRQRSETDPSEAGSSMWQMSNRSRCLPFEGLRKSGTGTNDTASPNRCDPVTASTSLCESPCIGHYGLRAVYKHAQRVQFTSPRLWGDDGSRALPQPSGEGKDSAAIYGCWPAAKCSSPQLSPASGAREYIEALISQ